LGSPLRILSAPILAPFVGHPFFTAQEVQTKATQKNRIAFLKGLRTIKNNISN
jgi:hypothetical protein